MKSLLKKYSDQNPEKFNKNFILSRDKQDILAYVTDIFKSLEVLDEVRVKEVTLETSESELGPIKNQHRYYKSILPSRLNRIHYKLEITPSESVPNIPILEDEKKLEIKEDAHVVNDSTFVKEGDILINKLIDNCFYINEGVRYFLIYQIVDNSTYGTEECVSLKSLLMPITIMHHEIVACPEYDAIIADPLPAYDVMLFSKKINPLLYTFAKDAYNSLIKVEIKDENRIIETWQNYRDPTLIEKFNKFWGINIKFSDKLESEDGRTYFQIKSEKDKLSGCYFSVPSEAIENDPMTKAVVGCLLDIKNETAKKRIVFNLDQLTSPWFWIDTMSRFFSKSSSDAIKKFEKVKTMLISLNRLMDDATRKILVINESDKRNTLTIIRYIIKNFEKLSKADSRDLDNKRLRLFEYQLFPLRKYFSDQIYRVLNSPTRSKAILDRMFSNLSPMKIIKETVTNELLRYYNSPNEMNLFSALLKCSFKGPQSLNKTVNVIQRDLHPSYTGRLSLIAAAAGDPGLTSVICPFVEITDDLYFKNYNKK